MPKTIAITPSWYWPAGIPRLAGIPPFSLYELCVLRGARRRPGDPAVVAGTTRMSAGDLRDEVDRLAGGILARAGSSRRAVMPDDVSLDNLLILLGALAANVHVYIVPRSSDLRAAARAFGTDLVLDGPGSVEPSAMPPGSRSPDLSRLTEPAVAIDGTDGIVNHSHRSLLAGALGLATFLDPDTTRPWLASVPLSRWEGLVSVLIPLYLGVPLVLPPSGGDAERTVETISREGVGYTFFELDEAGRVTRDAKKAVKDARRMLSGFLLSVRGMFDPDERRRVGRSFECPALTVWGMQETGAVFASHQSWYIDESVGIPVSNVHVVPADPRTGTPIQALWELVESAEVTVRTPSLMQGYDGTEHPERFTEGRFRTRMIASSDANGMIYLLGD